MPAASTIDTIKTELEELMKRKDITEQLIVAYRKQAQLDEKLILPDGFPRADLDLVAVRTARNKHACLQNDHIALMKSIEAKLGQLHKAKMNLKPKFHSTTDSEPTTPPFVTVDLVKPCSPAFLAGLIETDELVQIGSIDCTNFTALGQVASHLREMVNQPVTVFARRNGETLKLTLTPKQWDGAGLLGATLSKI